MKAAIDDMQTNVHDGVSINLYLHKQVVGRIWPSGCSSPKMRPEE